MKMLKITVSVVALCLIILMIYANVRTLSPTDKLKPVNMGFFSLQQPVTKAFATSLEKTIARTPGVTACSISASGNMASVVFHADVINESSLRELISTNAKTGVTKKVFESRSGGGCPVHAVLPAFSSLVSALDFRQ